MKRALGAALWVLVLVFAGVGAGTGARALDDPPIPSPDGGDDEGLSGRTGEGALGPAIVTVGYYIYDVFDVDIRSGTYIADFYLWFRYTGPRELELFEFMNAKSIERREESERRIVAGGTTYVCWRIRGTFRANFSLRDYPFDRQKLEIIIEHTNLETHELVYAHDDASYARSRLPPERWAIAQAIEVPQWKIFGVERRLTNFVYSSDFGDPDFESQGSIYSRLVLGIQIERMFEPYFYKILIPLVVILGMAYLVFWLPPDQIEAASLLAIVSLLATIAFQMNIAANLPEIGYLVVSDKFFICTYVLIFVNLVQSVVTYRWARLGQHARAEAWDRGCRWAFPVLYASGFVYLLLEALSHR